MRHVALFFSLSSLLVAGAPVTSEMSLQTPDGFTLKGTFTKPESKGRVPVVILAHEFGSQRSAWEPLVQQLQQRGLATLALDIRGHGASTMKNGQMLAITRDFMESAKTLGFDKIPEDLALAATWVRKQHGVDGHRLGLAGASVGGFSVILAAPMIHPIAVIALSPAGTGAFGKDAKAQLVDSQSKGRSATFIYASDQDTDAFENAQALAGISGVSAKFLPGKEHGMDYLKAHADTMAVIFAEHLKGRLNAAPAGTKNAEPKKPSNVITQADVDKAIQEKANVKKPGQ